MDNWADNEALRGTSHKPIYRRSLSELPSQVLHIPNVNRRSVEGNLLTANIPKSSSSMIDIQHSQKSENFIAAVGKNYRNGTDNDNGTANMLYTYIGISEPETEKHLYENRSIIEAQQKNMDFDAEQHDRM